MGDPVFLNATDWQEVGGLLLTLWWLFGSVLGFAGSILMAQGMLPSLGFTRDIPASAVKTLRPPLYASAGLFLALGIISVLIFLDRLDILTDIFNQGPI